MGSYWLLDRNGSKGPSVLIEADGAMRVIDVLGFGPKITSIEAQQEIWDDVVGGVVPTMKPFVAAAKLEVEPEAVHEDLEHGAGGGPNGRGRAKTKRKGGGGRSKGGTKRTGGRGRG